MRHQLHVINGSHPCAAVLRACELKGVDVGIREYLPPLHAPILRLRFGTGRVPLLVRGDGAVIRGSRAIMRALDEMHPTPLLYPAEHEAAIDEADKWGDMVLQDIARVLLWLAVKADPGALSSFQAGSHLPGTPRPLTRLMAPVIVAAEERLHRITPDRQHHALAALPDAIARIEAFDAAGAFGEGTPTAADLQIGASLQLLRAVGDVEPLIRASPVCRRVAKWLPPAPGRVPAGAIDPALLVMCGIDPHHAPAAA